MSEHSELGARASKTNHGNSDVAVAGCNCEACFNLRGELVNSHCAECGMALITAGEYHPYAACALYKQWGDSHAVRANLAAIIEHGNKPTGDETFHVDPTGKTREPPHCPSCNCGTETPRDSNAASWQSAAETITDVKNAEIKRLQDLLMTRSSVPVEEICTPPAQKAKLGASFPKPWTMGGNLVGTHRVGFAPFSYSRIVEVFGEPTETDFSEGSRTAFNWTITFADGTIAAIYEYKRSSLYGDGDDAPTPEEMKRSFTDWHIGGKSQRAVELVNKALSAGE